MARNYKRDSKGRFASTGSSKPRSGKGGTGLTRVNQNMRRSTDALNSAMDSKATAKARKSQTTARKAKAHWLDRAGAALERAGRGSYGVKRR